MDCEKVASSGCSWESVKCISGLNELSIAFRAVSGLLLYFGSLFIFEQGVEFPS